MAAGVQDFNRTEFDRLNEIKGHLEIALLEKHFLREYRGRGRGASLRPSGQGSSPDSRGQVWPPESACPSAARRAWLGRCQLLPGAKDSAWGGNATSWTSGHPSEPARVPSPTRACCSESRGTAGTVCVLAALESGQTLALLTRWLLPW